MKITVITISLNRGYEIEKTIQSVLTQTYQNLEYWVIDGGSTDETHQILERYKNQLNFVSEKDNGIYHAMNKGIGKSNGDYLIFLNAGDYFFSDLSLQTLIGNTNREDLIFGDILIKENDQSRLETFPDILSFDFFLNNYLPHPGTLIKRSLFNTVGMYNEANRIVSDWEFFLHSICKFNATYKHVSSEVSVFNAGGISQSLQNAQLHLTERTKVLDQHYSHFLKDYLDLAVYKNELQNFKNSRLHSVTDSIINSSIYRIFKRLYHS